MFEGFWSNLEAKNGFLKTSMDKIFEASSSFHMKYRTTVKF